MSRPRIKGRGQSQSEFDHITRNTKELLLPSVSFDGCDQDNGKLIFHPDGTGVFLCRTINWSARRGVRWHTDLAIRNADGLTLFGIGPFFSPTGPFAPIAEWASHFDFPEACFPKIAAAVPKHGCAAWFADLAPSFRSLAQPAKQTVPLSHAWQPLAMAF